MTYITVTYLDERPIASSWELASEKTLHLKMLMYSPFLADYSPGTVHILQLSNHLLKEGKNIIDLALGGDPERERFANAHG